MGVYMGNKLKRIRQLSFALLLPCVLVNSALAADNDARLLAMCQACHGSDGSSQFSSIPNLKWQNQQYLVQQLQQFKTGQRQDKTMTKVAKLLTTEQIELMATYFSKGEEK
ncbi:cytochrome C [Shewanella eurypsychrophilus]|uniref:Cytochrome C n=2 Tax=Shewanellaceae TaxID=267890 RepID=A0ABX6VD47_9GAMM|nr:cytochrome C [Shewanella eurypsychrophilus]